MEWPGRLPGPGAARKMEKRKGCEVGVLAGCTADGLTLEAWKREAFWLWHPLALPLRQAPRWIFQLEVLPGIKEGMQAVFGFVSLELGGGEGWR